jgi:eukaryotic-like serine/threonine-protein kinase
VAHSTLAEDREQLGPYELIREIAATDLIEVHLARTVGAEGLEQLVIVKRLAAHHDAASAAAASFLADARFVAALAHPNIARIHTVGEDTATNEIYLAREYVHGHDLEAVIAVARTQEAPIPLEAALSIIIAAAAALHHAHDAAAATAPSAAPYVELAASRIMVGYDGHVKLIDLGRSIGDAERRADVHTLGALFYELSVGPSPLGRALPTAVIPDYPAVLEGILLKALATDPAHRHASARDLAIALATFADNNRLRVTPVVASQLMSTLFPGRLEAWASARAQGAFFVEQCVVTTVFGAAPVDDATVVMQIPIAPDAADLADEDAPLPPPPQMRPSAPSPLLTPTKPIPVFAPAVPGTRSSSSNLVTPASPIRTSSNQVGSVASTSLQMAPIDVGEVTEQVHVTKRLPPPRARVARTVAMVAGFVATAALGALAFLALSQPDAVPLPASAELDEPPPPRVIASALPTTPEPPPAAAPPPPEPTEPIAVVAPLTPPPKTTRRAVAKPTAKTVKRRPAPAKKPKARKAEPKDEPWNDDSPFMPVRPGK